MPITQIDSASRRFDYVVLNWLMILESRVVSYRHARYGAVFGILIQYHIYLLKPEKVIHLVRRNVPNVIRKDDNIEMSDLILPTITSSDKWFKFSQLMPNHINVLGILVLIEDSFHDKTKSEAVTPPTILSVVS